MSLVCAPILLSSSLRNRATPHSLHCLSRQLIQSTPSLLQIVSLINAGRDSIGSVSRSFRAFIFSMELMQTLHRHCLNGVFVNDTMCAGRFLQNVLKDTFSSGCSSVYTWYKSRRLIVRIFFCVCVLMQTDRLPGRCTPFSSKKAGILSTIILRLYSSVMLPIFTSSRLLMPEYFDVIFDAVNCSRRFAERVRRSRLARIASISWFISPLGRAGFVGDA